MKPVFILLLAAMSFSCRAQEPAWQWALKVTGMFNAASDIKADASGNIYITGQFDTTAFFEGYPLASIPSDVSHNDIFLAKYTGAGSLLWVKRVSQNSSGYRNGMVLDASGNAYVTGTFSGPDSIEHIKLNGDGAYIAKYNAAGQLVWAKQVSNVFKDRQIASYGNNIYLAGSFFGQLAIDNITLTTAGQLDIFALKLNAAGDVLWAKSTGGTGNQTCEYIAIDGSGNLVFTGKNTQGSYLAKYSPQGDSLWMKNISAIQWASPLTADADDNIIALAGNYDINKYDGAGNKLWTRQFVFSEPGGLSGIAVDQSSGRNIYVAGHTVSFQKTASVSIGTLSFSTTMPRTDFVVQLKQNGDAVWEKMTHASDNDYVELSALTADGLGNIYIAGNFGADCVFGTNQLSLDSPDVINTYVAKLSSATGIEENLVSGAGFKAYPNPTTGRLTVTLNQNFDRFSMHDILGMEVAAGNLAPGRRELVLETAPLTEGIYYLTLSGTGGRAGQKIIVQK